MTRTSPKLAAAALTFFVPALIVAAFAGPAYALMTALIAAVIIGGLLAGGIVASTGDAPFAEDDATPAGDTPEHSRVGSPA